MYFKNVLDSWKVASWKVDFLIARTARCLAIKKSNRCGNRCGTPQYAAQKWEEMEDPGMPAGRAAIHRALGKRGRGGLRHLWLLAGGGLVRHELGVGVGLRGAHDLLARFGVGRLDRSQGSLC